MRSTKLSMRPFRSRVRVYAAVTGLLAASICVSAEASNTPAPRVEVPSSTMEAALNFSAKIMCSEHFISERPLDDIAKRSLLSLARAGTYRTLSSEYWPFTNEKYAAALKNAEVDEKRKTVVLKAGPYVGKARYYVDQGCVILNPLAEDAYFEPSPVTRTAPNDDVFPKDGPLLRDGATLPAEYNASLLQQAAAAALDPKHNGAAFLVMHKGKLVVEEYAQGVTKDRPLLNWSMGKSILATLIGRLEQKGLVSLDDVAPVDLWQTDKKDPRGAISLKNLLQMNSGLSCERRPPHWETRSIVAAHEFIYNFPVNVVQHAITSPPKNPPGESWSYSNCDMQVLGYVLKSLAPEGKNYLNWPYAELYNKIGMSGMVSEVDTYGNFHLTGFDYGTARDWVRYGLLYLNDGVWNGEQLLTEDFIKTVSTPGPTWYDDDGAFVSARGRSYGGGHWLNAGGVFALPKDAFYAAGFSDNYAVIVPSEDLVIVLLHTTSLEAEFSDPNTVFKPLLAGLGISEN